ncbi:MAG: PmoA family protein [Anaerolineae bacterium]|nr:PmoA family protein [Anaerolineae bacterium]
MRLTVHAGPHARVNCPVRAVLGEPLAPGVVLCEVETGQIVPCQPETIRGQAAVSWVVDALEAGAMRAYEVVVGETVGSATRVGLLDDGKQVEVHIGGALFTSYHYDPAYARPFLYPVIGPYGHGITRNYPMLDDVPGEKHDHKHHRSLYTAFGEVNGVDDWSEEKGHGRIVHRTFAALESGPVYGRVVAENDWVSRDGAMVVAETREMCFWDTPARGRLVDYVVTFHAGDAAVTFGDTKEGGILSVRVATSMDVTSKQGGQITNAYGGIDEDETWGKPSPWCDYSGPVGGRVVGIAVLDHPANLRHPTQWHVRNYGLMTANCFGWSYYQNDKSVDGSYTMPPQSDLCFRYRVHVHAGRAEGAAAAFLDYAFPPRVEVEV